MKVFPVKNKGKQQGFTLIELMVSVLIASVVMLALGGMLIIGIRSNQTSERRMDAVGLAQSLMIDATAQSLGSVSTPPAGNQNTAILNVTSNIVIVPDNPPVGWAQPLPLSGTGGVTISVTINWNERGIAKNVTLNSRTVR
ncbi:MAG: hypothetical protein BMS9Abin18_0738 [Zetaproteobacteria bacterium]|nr:MAG: hypothetical protein BMS9Abin18_0738 [Zetaproteobacteria bacterium]